MSAIWIDERPHRNPERLRRAHMRARAARRARRYNVTYHKDRKLVKHSIADRKLIDAFITMGALVALAIWIAAHSIVWLQIH